MYPLHSLPGAISVIFNRRQRDAEVAALGDLGNLIVIDINHTFYCFLDALASGLSIHLSFGHFRYLLRPNTAPVGGCSHLVSDEIQTRHEIRRDTATGDNFSAAAVAVAVACNALGSQLLQG